MKKRYYLCGIGYDKNNCITDYECDFGNFDTYEEAYECFVKIQCSSPESLFSHKFASYQMLIQLEECEETDDETTCIDVKNEWWIINPNFETNKEISFIGFKCKYCDFSYDDVDDDDVEETLWGHIQMNHEDKFEKIQNWETPDMIEECYRRK